MAASGEDVVGGDVEVHEDIDELLSETVRKYSVLYDKTSLSLSSSSSAVRRPSFSLSSSLLISLP